MRHVEEPAATASASGVPLRPTRSDEIAVITHLPRRRTAVEPRDARDTRRPRTARDPRDYAQHGPVVPGDAAVAAPVHRIGGGRRRHCGTDCGRRRYLRIPVTGQRLGRRISSHRPGWRPLRWGGPTNTASSATAARSTRRLFHTSVVFLAVVGTLAYAFTVELTRGVVVVGLPSAMLLSLIVHWGARQMLHALRRRWPVHAARRGRRVGALGRRADPVDASRAARRPGDRSCLHRPPTGRQPSRAFPSWGTATTYSKSWRRSVPTPSR